MITVVQPHQAPGAPLDIGVQRLVGLVEVALDGSLDERTVDDLCRALEVLFAEGAASIELDCTELLDVDGFGLALLLQAHRHLTGKGGRLIVRYAQPPVLDRLRAAALDAVLTVAA